MTNKRKLFAAIYEACPELKHTVYQNGGTTVLKDKYIHLEHLLRTVRENEKYLVIDCEGTVSVQKDNDPWVEDICQLDLSRPVDEWNEETLNKLAEIIL